jgi:hypothetical protein
MSRQMAWYHDFRERTHSCFYCLCVIARCACYALVRLKFSFNNKYCSHFIVTRSSFPRRALNRLWAQDVSLSGYNADSAYTRDLSFSIAILCLEHQDGRHGSQEYHEI